jgi:hypothetical protein
VNQAHRQRALEALQRVVVAEHRAGHLYDTEAAALSQYLQELKATGSAASESRDRHGYVR